MARLVFAEVQSSSSEDCPVFESGYQVADSADAQWTPVAQGRRRLHAVLDRQDEHVHDVPEPGAEHGHGDGDLPVRRGAELLREHEVAGGA